MNPFSSSSHNSMQNFTTGLVTDNHDPENQGRVKIQFPWDNDSNESYWARIVTPMSGNSFGVNFLPEIEDEVLVCFLAGDIQKPVIIGSLWNKNLMPPYPNEDGENNIRAIKSRSGHEIIFDDSNSQEKIEIKSKSGHKITMDDTAGGEKIMIEDKNGNSIEMDALTNKITLKSSMQLSLEANIIDIKADSMLTLQGGIVKVN